MLTVSLAKHWLPGFTVTTYWVVLFGDAKGLITPGFVNPVAGDQLYVVPFTAVVASCMAVPLQMAVSAMVFTVGCGSTDTNKLSFAGHWLAWFTVITYSVVPAGVAKGLNTPGFDKPVAGDQVYVLPLTDVVTSWMVVPLQMVVSAMVFTVGR
jgi:hypothetical protein